MDEKQGLHSWDTLDSEAVFITTGNAVDSVTVFGDINLLFLETVNVILKGKNALVDATSWGLENGEIVLDYAGRPTHHHRQLYKRRPRGKRGRWKTRRP